MRLLVSDANIFIDMEEGGLLELMFKLPYEFCVPDVLFAEELAQQHGHQLEAKGLTKRTLNSEAMAYAFSLTQVFKGPSINDCLALALAKFEVCSLLTGDKALRQAAKHEAVEVKGTVWLVEELLTHHLITVDEALNAYALMRTNARRLPWKQAAERLNKFEN